MLAIFHEGARQVAPPSPPALMGMTSRLVASIIGYYRFKKYYALNLVR